MGLLENTLQNKSLADYTNTHLRLALGAVLYTNTADMWNKYLQQRGYSGSVADMMARWFVDNNVPMQFRNYINAGITILIYPTAGDYLLDALNGNYFTDENGNRLTA